jgi:hypothetical protein
VVVDGRVIPLLYESRAEAEHAALVLVDKDHEKGGAISTEQESLASA